MYQDVWDVNVQQIVPARLQAILLQGASSKANHTMLNSTRLSLALVKAASRIAGDMYAKPTISKFGPLGRMMNGTN
jgi:hypothetical protein